MSSTENGLLLFQHFSNSSVLFHCVSVSQTLVQRKECIRNKQNIHL